VARALLDEAGKAELREALGGAPDGGLPLAADTVLGDYPNLAPAARPGCIRSHASNGRAARLFDDTVLCRQGGAWTVVAKTRVRLVAGDRAVRESLALRDGALTVIRRQAVRLDSLP
jgi:hypothetical protein